MEGRGFDSQGPTNTQGLKITARNEGTQFPLQAAEPSRGSDDHVKIASLISPFVLNTLTIK